MTTINAEISGRGLSDLVDNHLGFYIEDIFGEHAFDNKNIFVDLYTPDDTLLGTYNVKDMFATGQTIPITIDNGLSYKLDVRFEQIPEPATLSLLALAAILLRRKELLH